MDFDAISTALAARFAPGAVTPPVDLTNIRSSTGNLPNQLGALPCVLVVPVEGEFATGNGTRQGGHDFTVNFYLAETALADLSRDVATLRRWLSVLVDQLKASAQLGGLVSRATVDRWTLGAMSYANQTYSGIELSVRIVTNEGWVATA